MTDGAAFGGGAARTAAVLGHELRNPLGAALANAALACELTDANDPRRAVLDSVVRELERTSALLDGYLAFARSGMPARMPVSLAGLAVGTASRWPQVRCQVPTDCMVLGDELLLERVLDNLVDNAIRAGARSVDLGAQTCGGSVVIRVSDDGPGIPADVIPHIFAPGFSTRSSSGLGLSIIAETIAAHGGTIHCEAGAKGSCFAIELPLLVAATAN